MLRFTFLHVISTEARRTSAQRRNLSRIERRTVKPYTPYFVVPLGENVRLRTKGAFSLSCIPYKAPLSQPQAASSISRTV